MLINQIVRPMVLVAACTLLLTACADNTDNTASAHTPDNSGQTTSAPADHESSGTHDSPQHWSDALNGNGRSETDQARDAGRRPVDVLTFVGIKPDMTVVDLIAASGYYTEVLAHAVGPQGTVVAHNTPFVLQMRDGANEKAMAARLADNRLPNVMRRDVELPQLTLDDGPADAFFTALNFHDLAQNAGVEATVGLLNGLYELAAPGAVFGIVDHIGLPEHDNKAAHRIPVQEARDIVNASRWVLEAEGDMLRNPDDDHAAFVFDPAVRGNTDRFVFRLRKPE